MILEMVATVFSSVGHTLFSSQAFFRMLVL